MTIELPIVEPRQCGTCVACCVVLGVPEIKKPPMEPCPHIDLAGGCKIYETRPVACRNYRCMWLDGKLADDELRPDVLGVLFTLAPMKFSGKRSVIQAHGFRPGAIESEPVQKIINFMNGNGQVVMIIEADKMRRMIASRENQWLIAKYYNKMKKLAGEA